MSKEETLESKIPASLASDVIKNCAHFFCRVMSIYIKGAPKWLVPSSYDMLYFSLTHSRMCHVDTKGSCFFIEAEMGRSYGYCQYFLYNVGNEQSFDYFAICCFVVCARNTQIILA